MKQKLMPFRFIGSKANLAPYIVSLFPPHNCYVEVFSGSAAVLFARTTPSKVEVINDINGDIVNFMLLLRDRTQELFWKCQFTPYSRTLFLEYQRLWRQGGPKDPLERAVVWYFLQSAAVSGHFSAGWGHSDQSNKADEFHHRVDKLMEMGRRLRHVAIECRDYRDVICIYDSCKTLFYCVPPGQRVRMANEDLKAIEKVMPGEEVLGGTVQGIWDRPYSGPLVQIKVRGIPWDLSLTPNHQVYAARAKEAFELVGKTRPSRLWRKKHLIPQYIEAGHLQKGDVVFIPLSGNAREPGYIEIPADGIRPSRGMVTLFQEDEDLGWLVGLYLAEGSINGIYYTQWNLSNLEKEQALRAQKIVRDKWGLNTYLMQDVNSTTVGLCAKPITNWFLTHCGKGAHNKMLSPFLMTAPLGVQQAILNGWIAGDGHFQKTHKRYNSSQLLGSTRSQVLAEQLFLIFLRLGYRPTIRRKESRSGIDWFIGLNANSEIARFLDREPVAVRTQYRMIQQGYMIAPVEEIQQVEYTGPVYNLSISPSHHYTINLVQVANCDPPYALDTAGERTFYGSPFTWEDHSELAYLLNTIQGKAIVSYYPHKFTDPLYKDWIRLEVDVPKSSSGIQEGRQKPRATELLLLNFEPGPMFQAAGMALTDTGKIQLLGEGET